VPGSQPRGLTAPAGDYMADIVRIGLRVRQ
jgi:hypothetical protein